MKNWFKDWFASEDYLKVYNHRNSEDARNLSDLIIKNINPNKNDIILDAACGAGRHGLYLSSLGYKIVGFDLSPTLLYKAKKESIKTNSTIDLVQADIRQIHFKTKIFAVLNLFTSFGYFNSDEENFKFVFHAHDFLIQNGYYVLDYFNKKYLEKNLVPFSRREIDGINITEERHIENERVNKKITLFKNDGEKVFYESVRLYDYKFIIEKFSEIGFKIAGLYGDYNGGIYDENNSSRLIIIFKK